MTYVFVVDVEDPDDADEIIDAAKEYVHDVKGALDSPDTVDVLDG